MIFSNSDFIITYKKVSQCIQEVEPIRIETLLRNGMFMRILPLIVTSVSMGEFNLIYFDFADFGNPLFDRYMTLEKFILKFKPIPHRRIHTPKGEIMEWPA